MRKGRGIALLLIDVINAFDFKGSEGIVAAAARFDSPIVLFTYRHLCVS